MHVRRSVDIAAPPERIWPFLVEPDNVLKWYPTLRTFQYEDAGQGGPGAKVYAEEKASGMLMKLHFVINDWVEYRTVSFHMVSGTGVKGYDQSWVVEAAAGRVPLHLRGARRAALRRPRQPDRQGRTAQLRVARQGDAGRAQDAGRGVTRTHAHPGPASAPHRSVHSASVSPPTPWWEAHRAPGGRSPLANCLTAAHAGRLAGGSGARPEHRRRTAPSHWRARPPPVGGEAPC